MIEKGYSSRTSRWFYPLLIFVIGLLVIIRSLPYFLYGSFGFGYDTGIYKNVFEHFTTFSSVFSSQIYVFPAFLAYFVNLIGIPVDWLLYYGYIWFSILIAWPLYLLTREFFGKVVGLVAVAIFAVSYVQVFASEYYLFKEMLGGIFMLFGFFYYVKKSNWFYLFAALTALTQLPLFLILALGVGISGLFNLKKDLEFNLKGLAMLSVVVAFLVAFVPQHLETAFNVVMGALEDTSGFDPHQSGSFISVGVFLQTEWLLLIFGALGFSVSLKKRKIFPLHFSVVLLSIIVFFQLFFERRYLITLSLLMIPYEAYLLTLCYSITIKKLKWAKYPLAGAFVGFLVLATGFHYLTTYPSLNDEEQWALQVLIEKTDSEYVMATNSYYAPWLYGFSGKTTLAPGIFVSPWSLEDWNKYTKGDEVFKANALIAIANQYGKYYVMEGARQVYTRADKGSDLVKRIFDVNGVRIYEVFPSSVVEEGQPVADLGTSDYFVLPVWLPFGL